MATRYFVQNSHLSASRRTIYISPIAALAFAIQIVILSSVIISIKNTDQWSLSTICIVVTLQVAATLVLAIRCAPRGVWSLSSVYLIMLAVFHFGFSSLYGFGLAEPFQVGQSALWWFRPSTADAIALTGLGFVACGLGVLAGRTNQRPYPLLAPTYGSREKQALGLVGALLTTVSISLWFLVVISSGGPSLLFSSYATYLELTVGHAGIIAFVWFALGIGLSFVALGQAGRLRTASLIYFVAFAVIALPLGLRGEVMFASLAALTVLARRRRMPSARITLIGLLLGLFVISLLREVRTTGLAAVSPRQLSPSISKGLVELGSSLRPVTEVVDWHDRGEPLIGGASYWAPIDRALCRISPAPHCRPAESDDRIMNVFIQDRVGPIGFSPIAEAFWNFGTTGVTVIMFLFGWMTSFLDRSKQTWWSEALSSVIFVEFLINIRNSFIVIPSHMVAGAMIIACIGFTLQQTRSLRIDSKVEQ